jgi:hypothetical protein
MSDHKTTPAVDISRAAIMREVARQSAHTAALLLAQAAEIERLRRASEWDAHHPAYIAGAAHARRLMAGERTPDGGRYNFTTIREAMEGGGGMTPCTPFKDFLRAQHGDKWVVALRLTAKLRDKGYTAALSPAKYAALELAWARECARSDRDIMKAATVMVGDNSRREAAEIIAQEARRLLPVCQGNIIASVAHAMGVK